MKPVALALLLVLACIAGCLDAAADPPAAGEIAARFVEAEEQTEDFTAVVTITAGSETVTARLFRKAPESYRLEYLKPADLAGTVVVSNGTRKWRYDPTTQTALTVAGPYINAVSSDPPYPGWAEEVRGYDETVAETLAEQNASYRGSETVGGRTAYVLEVAGESPLLEAPTRYREGVYRLKAWIDTETRLLLGVEMYGVEGGPILSVRYAEPSANTGLSDALFTFDPPAGVEVGPMPTYAITPLFLSSLDGVRRCGVDGLVPSYLPEGYAFAYGVYLPGAYAVLQFKNSSSGEQLTIMQRLYDPYQEDGALPGTPEPVTLSGDRQAEYVSVDGRDQLRWNADGYSYGLTGGLLGRDELVRVAESTAV
jgi:outer membrane lipoprotein-sorting protein